MKTIFAILFFAAVFSFSAKLFAAGPKRTDAVPVVFAQTPEEEKAEEQNVTDKLRSSADEIIRALETRMGKYRPACFYCQGEGYENIPKPSNTCRAAYSALYKDPVVQMHVTLGLSDAPKEGAKWTHQWAEDAPRKEVWVKNLKRKCGTTPEGGPRLGNCGFTQVSADVFTKDDVEGPDGKTHTVRLTLMSSSLEVGALKKAKADPVFAALQERQSARAKDNYMSGLSEPVNIYAGHARYGTGLGFTARNASDLKSGAVRDEMMSELQKSPSPPIILANFACDGQKWYAGGIRAATRGRTGTLSSTGPTEAEVAFAKAYATLDSVLALRCEDDFMGAVNSFNRYNPEHQGPDQLAEMDGFLKPVPGSLAPSVAEENLKAPSSAVQGGSITPQPLIHPTGDANGGIRPQTTQSAEGVN